VNASPDTAKAAPAKPKPAGALLTTEDLAALLGDVSVRTLEKWRRVGGGPDFVPLGRGRVVRYRPQAVDRWLAAKERSNNSQKVA
jgi:phage terminase Nu1 subunit (DNA packaging protein)